MYKTKKYVQRDLDDVFAEIDILAQRYPDARRVFLADGDALALPMEHLSGLLKYLKRAFVKLTRVSLYASAQNLLEKSEAELRHLREEGLSLLYYGIETGSDTVLTKICKGVDSEAIIASLNRAVQAGMKVSATVILGIGGRAYSREHIEATAAVVNAVEVNYLSTLQLGLDEDAEKGFRQAFADFEMLDDVQMLEEQKRFLELLKPAKRVIFRSNHASNALHLAGTLPKDKQRLIDEVTAALTRGEDALVPQRYRGF